MKHLIIRITYYLLGGIILSLGIELSVLSHLGSGAYDALNYNLSKLLHISLGQAMAISVILLFIITMILKPRWKFFIGLLLSLYMSFFIDLFDSILVAPESIYFRIIYLLLGIIGIGLGVALIIRSDFTPNPLDNLMVLVAEKLKIAIHWSKILLESLFAIIATGFGFWAGIGFGAIAVGTVVMAFAVGPTISFFLKFIKEIKIKK